MELYAYCQDFAASFNVKFAKKYCPESKNPEQAAKDFQKKIDQIWK